MSETDHPLAQFLKEAMARDGLDRKSLGKAMASNPGKFYRRFDAWMRPGQGQRVDMPDLQIAQRLAEVLSVEVSAIWEAARAELAPHFYTVTDKGKDCSDSGRAAPATAGGGSRQGPARGAIDEWVSPVIPSALWRPAPEGARFGSHIRSIGSVDRSDLLVSIG